MKLKNLTKEELESMSYAELTELILTENKDKMKIVDIFKKICSLLELSETEFENRIADFFELVSTDKNFVVLEKGFCDLRKKHNVKLVVEDDEEEEATEQELTEDEETNENADENEEDIFYDNSSDEDDVNDVEEELSDFVMVDEEETSI